MNFKSYEAGVRKTLLGLEGVAEILTRAEAATRFHLPPATIGELVVLADETNMLGEMDQTFRDLPKEYRNHGSTFEMEVPLIIYNCPPPRPADEYQYNKDLTCGLWS